MKHSLYGWRNNGSDVDGSVGDKIVAELVKT